MTKKLMTEMQALIAFACYDCPAIAQGGDSMTENLMAENMAALYLAAMTQRSSATMTSSSSQVHGSVHKFRT